MKAILVTGSAGFIGSEEDMNEGTGTCFIND